MADPPILLLCGLVFLLSSSHVECCAPNTVNSVQRTLVFPELVEILGEDCPQCADHLPFINEALQEYDLDCSISRMALFLSEVVSATNGLTIFINNNGSSTTINTAGALPFPYTIFSAACLGISSLRTDFETTFAETLTLQNCTDCNSTCTWEAENIASVVASQQHAYRMAAWFFTEGAASLDPICSDLFNQTEPEGSTNWWLGFDGCVEILQPLGLAKAQWIELRPTRQLLFATILAMLQDTWTPTSSPTSTSTPSSTSTPTASATPTSSSTSTLTNTNVPTHSQTPTATSTTTQTQTATPTQTTTGTSTPVPTLSATSTGTPTLSYNNVSLSPTSTPTSSATQTPTATPTRTLLKYQDADDQDDQDSDDNEQSDRGFTTPTSTATFTGTPSVTPKTLTTSITLTYTKTITPVPTYTPSPTRTATGLPNVQHFTTIALLSSLNLDYPVITVDRLRANNVGTSDTPVELCGSEVVASGEGDVSDSPKGAPLYTEMFVDQLTVKGSRITFCDLSLSTHGSGEFGGSTVLFTNATFVAAVGSTFVFTETTTLAMLQNEPNHATSISPTPQSDSEQDPDDSGNAVSSGGDGTTSYIRTTSSDGSVLTILPEVAALHATVVFQRNSKTTFAVPVRFGGLSRCIMEEGSSIHLLAAASPDQLTASTSTTQSAEETPQVDEATLVFTHWLTGRLETRNSSVLWIGSNTYLGEGFFMDGGGGAIIASHTTKCDAQITRTPITVGNSTLQQSGEDNSNEDIITNEDDLTSGGSGAGTEEEEQPPPPKRRRRIAAKTEYFAPNRRLGSSSKAVLHTGQGSYGTISVLGGHELVINNTRIADLVLFHASKLSILGVGSSSFSPSFVDSVTATDGIATLFIEVTAIRERLTVLQFSALRTERDNVLNIDVDCSKVCGLAYEPTVTIGSDQITLSTALKDVGIQESPQIRVILQPSLTHFQPDLWTARVAEWVEVSPFQVDIESFSTVNGSVNVILEFQGHDANVVKEIGARFIDKVNSNRAMQEDLEVLSASWIEEPVDFSEIQSGYGWIIGLGILVGLFFVLATGALAYARYNVAYAHWDPGYQPVGNHQPDRGGSPDPGGQDVASGSAV